MVVYVKMIKSQLSISEAWNVFDVLPVKFGHGSSHLLPYHSSLSEASSIESSEDEIVKYKIWEKRINKKKMRMHVGAHILKDDMKDTCRFCGESVGKCNIKIVNGSDRGKVTTEVSNSGCD